MANKTSFLTFFNTTLWLDSASTLAIVELNTSYLPTILASIVPSLSASFPLPPGPSPWPILGSIPALVRNKPRYKWILGLMKEMNTEIACIRLGNVHIISVTSPELAREFLQKQDAVFASRPRTMATEHLSRGFLTTIVTPWGDQWKKMRRVVTSEMVSHARLEWLLGKRNEEANNLVFYVQSQCNKNSLIGGEVINLRLLTRQFSGNIIRKMIFNNRYFGKGRKDGRPGIEEIEHVDAAFEVLIYVYAFGIQDYLPCLRWLDLDGHEKIIKRAMGVVNKYHDPIIEERIRQRSNGTTKNKVPEDLLDVLISLKDEKGKPLLSVEEIKAQVVVRFFYEDIRLSYHLCHGPFNCIGWIIHHTVVSGYFIPKGSHVLLSRAGLDRNPRIWHELLNFNPERHLMSKDGGIANVNLIERELRLLLDAEDVLVVHLGRKLLSCY
ncbi:hypothetical protein C5167_001502 [Papaver somniferum]|uniref:Uncharacterized protein n=1 Tax=Papaver somniferum TaxID=3469 RepID=A0A4Y7KW83_PAPSO|nr:hypothetical protein C5167_001502 [Papaver somniferum]